MVTPPLDAAVAREQVTCPAVERPSSPSSSLGRVIPDDAHAWLPRGFHHFTGRGLPLVRSRATRQAAAVNQLVIPPSTSSSFVSPQRFFTGYGYTLLPATEGGEHVRVALA